MVNEIPPGGLLNTRGRFSFAFRSGRTNHGQGLYRSVGTIRVAPAAAGLNIHEQQTLTLLQKLVVATYMQLG
jgi:hypothetical protein